MTKQMGVQDLDRLSFSDLEKIDEICESFEAGCTRGNAVAIEQFMEDVDERICGSLLCELIKLEIDYRRRAGSNPNKREYVRRFPSGLDAVNAAFDSADSDDFSLSSLQYEVDYEVGELLARGGLGEIYVGFDRKLQRRVAIKIPGNRSANSIEQLRLRQEAKITGQLDHPNIVPVYSSRLGDDDWPCYTMQLIEGQTLRDEVRQFHSNNTQLRCDSFRFRRLLRSLISVCNAVAYAHTQNVIHRDIKPGNIMLGSFGETLLIDWGLAKQLGSPADDRQEPAKSLLPESESWNGSRDDTAPTIAGQPIGTPEYASPEQMSGRTDQQDFRTDVFSLGATLYYILTGEKPNVVVSIQGITGNQKSAVNFNPSIPEELAAICTKAMAMQRQHRYQNVSLLVDDLERYLADEPVSVHNPSTLTRFRRWSNKNPRWLSGVITGILVAVIATTIGAFLLGQKNNDLQNANTSLIRSNDKLTQSRQKTANVLHAVTDQTMLEFFGRKQSLMSEDNLFLDDLLKQYLSFAESIEDGSNSTELQLEANFRLAQIRNLLGQSQEALKTLERSLELVNEFDGEFTPRIRNYEAHAMVKSGDLLLQLGQPAKGETRLLQSKRKLNQLRSEFEEEDYLLHLAKSSASLGVTFLESNRLQQAIENLEQGVEIYNRLLQLTTLENHHYQHDLACVHTNLGIALWTSRQDDAAQKNFEVALGIHDTLAESRGPVLEYRLERVKTMLALANLQRRNKSPQAEPTFLNVIEECTRLTKEYPGLPVNYVTLARAHQFLGQMHMFRPDRGRSLEQTRLAVNSARNAVQLEPDLEKYQYTLFTSQMSLAVVLRLTGNRTEAAETYVQCIELGESILKKFRNAKYRLGLARAHYAFAILKNSQSLPNEAKTRFATAREILAQGTASEQQMPGFRKLKASIEKELSKLDSKS